MKMETVSKLQRVNQTSNQNSGKSKLVEGGNSKMYESAHFENIMVEFETDHREMAVDVPDSFIGHYKTPPKYPPPNTANNSLSRNGTVSSFSPPQLGSRKHLRIEEDGHLLNRSEAPAVPVRALVSPTPEQAERIKKYSSELSQRNHTLELKNVEKEFLRDSLRHSKKLTALSQNRRCIRGMTLTVEHLSGALNRLDLLPLPTPSDKWHDTKQKLQNIFDSVEFKSGIKLCNLIRSSKMYVPMSSELRDVASDCLTCLLDDQLSVVNDIASELSGLITKLEMIFYVHDRISLRKMAYDSLRAEEALLDRLSIYSETNIKVVRIEKTSDPLGATIKNSDDAIVVGRIIRGGAASRSGLLQEGDEILEVNEVPLRGRNVNEVYDLLNAMKGLLTLLVVPSRLTVENNGGGGGGLMHVRARIDYNPDEDPYVPCRELGLSFVKGNILTVINQTDPHWWQAYREGDRDLQNLPGLIPSSSFNAQREAMKISMEEGGLSNVGGSLGRRIGGGSLFCGGRRRRSLFKGGKRHSGESFDFLDFDGGGSNGVMDKNNSFQTYEEVVLYFPRSSHKRPIVLIGPPNIGRHELRQRLMLDTSKFAAAIPHTSRAKRPDEIDGQDYIFISRLQFEQDILGRKFVEHGEFERSYYGTSIDSIRAVVRAEKICVLNLHPQSLKILKYNTDLMPFVVFVAPPSLEKLKRQTAANGPADEAALRNVIERAREMEAMYDDYFDMVITYGGDPDKAFLDLQNQINILETQPQWVPADWQKFWSPAI